MASFKAKPPAGTEHRAGRDLQRLGHLGGGHVVEIRQHQHLAVDGRQARERLDDIEFVVQPRVGRRLLGLLFIVQRLHAGCGLAKAAAAHDLKEPGPCQRSVAQLLPVLPGVGKTVLHHVFGNGARTSERPRTAQQKR